MANIKAVVVVLCGLAFAGCATSPVVKGTLIGAAAGAALGAGTGALVSDEDLLGSPKSQERGNLALHPGSTIGVGTLIGVAFGALVGAMIGHGQDDGSTEVENVPPAAAAQRVQPSAF